MTSTRTTAIPQADLDRLVAAELRPLASDLESVCHTMCHTSPELAFSTPKKFRGAYRALMHALFEYCKIGKEGVDDEFVRYLCGRGTDEVYELWDLTQALCRLHALEFDLARYAPADYLEKKCRYSELARQFIDRWFARYIDERYPRPKTRGSTASLEDVRETSAIAVDGVVASIPRLRIVNADAHKTNALAIVARSVQESAGWPGVTCSTPEDHKLNLQHLCFAGRCFQGRLCWEGVCLDGSTFQDARFQVDAPSARSSDSACIHGSARGCNFRRVVFSGAVCVKGAAFDDSDFSGADLTGMLTHFPKEGRACSADLVSFCRCNFDGAWATLDGADLRGDALLAHIRDKWGGDTSGAHFHTAPPPPPPSTTLAETVPVSGAKKRVRAAAPARIQPSRDSKHRAREWLRLFAQKN